MLMKRVFTLLMSMFLVTRVFAVFAVARVGGRENCCFRGVIVRGKRELDGASPVGRRTWRFVAIDRGGRRWDGELDDRGVFVPAAARCGTGERGWGR